MWHYKMNKMGFICSACHKKSKLPVKVKCFNCNKEFEVKREKVRQYRGKNFYCSKECRHQKVGSLISKVKKEQAPVTSEQTKLNWNDPEIRERRRLGLKKFAATRKNGHNVSCNVCGTSFYLPKCRIEGSHLKLFYCSVKCRDSDPELFRKRMLAAQRSPTRPEQVIIDLINKYKLPYKYVGDGKVSVGKMLPDFVHNTEQWAVDLFGDYFHSEKFAKRTGLPYETPEERIEKFKVLGWKLKVVWASSLTKPNHEKDILDLFTSLGR